MAQFEHPAPRADRCCASRSSRGERIVVARIFAEYLKHPGLSSRFPSNLQDRLLTELQYRTPAINAMVCAYALR